MPIALQKSHHLEKIYEGITWAIVIIALIFVKFLPQNLINNDEIFYFIGAIISFALLYYLVLFNWLNKTKRIWLKSIIDVIFIGILIHLIKDYGQYFYVLYFIPVASVAMTLNLINSLLMAAFVSLMLGAEFLINNSVYSYSGENLFFTGPLQIIFLLFITLFCRTLAMNLRHEKELRELAETKLQKADEAMKSIETREKEFISMTSHQLFTPLSIIRGYCSNLLSGHLGKLNKDQEKYLNSIHISTTNMVDIVSNLLNITHIESKKIIISLEPADINEVIKLAIEHISLESEYKKIPIQFIPQKLPKVFIDPVKITESLYNLLDNAIRYSKGKKVVINAEQGKNEFSNDLIISVKDFGQGIPQNEQQNVFKEFFHGSNNRNKGNGLGLFIVKALVNKQNGKIWFESKEGKGTTFYLSLPIAKQ
ncbi:MAG: HAMP domain-containing sensor histidine kinase [Patescibacteria group bacterium]|jgi:signal transduction histidine kinase